MAKNELKVKIMIYVRQFKRSKRLHETNYTIHIIKYAFMFLSFFLNLCKSISCKMCKMMQISFSQKKIVGIIMHSICCEMKCIVKIIKRSLKCCWKKNIDTSDHWIVSSISYFIRLTSVIKDNIKNATRQLQYLFNLWNRLHYYCNVTSVKTSTNNMVIVMYIMLKPY